MNTNSTTTVVLPGDLCRAIEAKLQGTRFATIDEFLTFVLKELLQDEAEQMDEREQALIEERLRDLGYI